ncbi:AraC family transcriptional regulator [Chitinophagaceae bacterium MMS25-I14]
MRSNKIKTRDTATFRRQFMQPGPEADAMLQQSQGRFFIVPVEEMFKLITLPVPPTRATTHSVIFITEGEAIMSIGSDTYTIHAGECFAVAAGQVFSFRHPDVNKGFICNFHDDFLAGRLGKKELLHDFEFLTVWGNPCIRPDIQAAVYIRQLMERLCAEYIMNGTQHADLLQAYLTALLYELKYAYVPLSGSKQVKSVSLTNHFKELLFAHIRATHRVSDYASMMHITPNHLNKVVKEITGKSPTTWIDEMLILEAKVLLYQTDFPIGEIAAELGFDDPSYFSRLFKKYEGTTPVAFRKMIETS